MFVAPVEPKVQITNPPRVFPAAGTDEVISASNQIVKDPCRPPLTSKDVKNTSWPRNLRDPIRPKAQGLFTPEPDRWKFQFLERTTRKAVTTAGRTHEALKTLAPALPVQLVTYLTKSLLRFLKAGSRLSLLASSKINTIACVIASAFSLVSNLPLSAGTFIGITL